MEKEQGRTTSGRRSKYQHAQPDFRLHSKPIPTLPLASPSASFTWSYRIGQASASIDPPSQQDINQQPSNPALEQHKRENLIGPYSVGQTQALQHGQPCDQQYLQHHQLQQYHEQQHHSNHHHHHHQHQHQHQHQHHQHQHQQQQNISFHPPEQNYPQQKANIPPQMSSYNPNTLSKVMNEQQQQQQQQQHQSQGSTIQKPREHSIIPSQTTTTHATARTKVPLHPPKKSLIETRDMSRAAIPQASTGSKPRKAKWTENEDQMLHSLVQKYGQDAWAAISLELPGRSASQCRNRWIYWQKLGFRTSIAMFADMQNVATLRPPHYNQEATPSSSHEQQSNSVQSSAQSATQSTSHPSVQMLSQQLPLLSVASPETNRDSSVRTKTKRRQSSRSKPPSSSQIPVLPDSLTSDIDNPALNSNCMIHSNHAKVDVNLEEDEDDDDDSRSSMYASTQDSLTNGSSLEVDCGSPLLNSASSQETILDAKGMEDHPITIDQKLHHHHYKDQHQLHQNRQQEQHPARVQLVETQHNHYIPSNPNPMKPFQPIEGNAHFLPQVVHRTQAHLASAIQPLSIGIHLSTTDQGLPKLPPPSELVSTHNPVFQLPRIGKEAQPPQLRTAPSASPTHISNLNDPPHMHHNHHHNHNHNHNHNHHHQMQHHFNHQTHPSYNPEVNIHSPQELHPLNQRKQSETSEHIPPMLGVRPHTHAYSRTQQEQYPHETRVGISLDGSVSRSFSKEIIASHSCVNTVTSNSQSATRISAHPSSVAPQETTDPVDGNLPTINPHGPSHLRQSHGRRHLPSPHKLHIHRDDSSDRICSETNHYPPHGTHQNRNNHEEKHTQGRLASSLSLQQTELPQHLITYPAPDSYTLPKIPLYRQQQPAKQQRDTDHAMSINRLLN